jgi:acetyl esterase
MFTRWSPTRLSRNPGAAGLLLLAVALAGCARGDALPWLQTSPPTADAALNPVAAIGVKMWDKKVPDFTKTPVAELRAKFDEATRDAPRLKESVAKVENRRIPGPAADIPLRIYTPRGKPPRPIILFIHGGGWVMGSLDGYDDLCRSLCHRADAVVVSVDYRLAPEFKYPAAPDDCFAALKWTADHAADLGGDPKRLTVAGDSAGGNLSAVLTLMAKDRGGPPIARQVLIYPATSAALATLSSYNFAKGYGLSREMAVWFWQQYLPSPADGEQPHASPMRAADLAGLPPALVITAQYDMARDDGEAYAARLHAAGVPVRCVRYLGMTHGFVSGGAIYAQARTAMDEIARWVRAAP